MSADSREREEGKRGTARGGAEGEASSNPADAEGSLKSSYDAQEAEGNPKSSHDTDADTRASIPARKPTQMIPPLGGKWNPPAYVWRTLAALMVGGQVVVRILRGRVHLRNTLQQLEAVGPRSLGVCLLTASFVGMAFTIQFVREFARLGLTRAVGGVLSLALSRELSPVVTAIVVAGRVGSAFAAELGTMQVSEQTDTLRVLRTDPIDYLVTPRVIACSLALPILTLVSFTVGMAASVLLAESVYNVSANIILDSARKALQPWDFISTMTKSMVFGGIISVVSCAWGVTTLGGAKGVGESTTSAVVISLVWIFIADFLLSWCFFHGAGDALKRMG
jgi:ABC transport permease subunit